MPRYCYLYISSASEMVFVAVSGAKFFEVEHAGVFYRNKMIEHYNSLPIPLRNWCLVPIND